MNATNGIVKTTNRLFKVKRKAHVPEDMESQPQLSDSSSRKSDSLGDINYSKSKRKKRNKKEKSLETQEIGLVILIVEQL